MKDYNLVLFKPENWNHCNLLRITIGKSYISMTKLAYQAIGEPKKVDVYYNKENNAIRIIFSETGNIVTITKDSQRTSSKISEVMPMGRYYYDSEDNVFLKKEEEK